MFTGLTTVEAAEIIGVERSTLSRWIAARRITPLAKLPGRSGAYLFDPAEVERVRAAYEVIRGVRREEAS